MQANSTNPTEELSDKMYDSIILTIVVGNNLLSQDDEYPAEVLCKKQSSLIALEIPSLNSKRVFLHATLDELIGMVDREVANHERIPIR